MSQRWTTLGVGIGLLLAFGWFTVNTGSSRVLRASEKQEAAAKPDLGAKVTLEPAVRRYLGKRATVLIFLGTGCPVSNAYLPHLNELAKKYEPQGVRFVGVNANAQDS